ncbi:pantetheine-phosphate adenylyltransferase [Oscillospiraceae bacterium OttesenSCG-928-F05]|nr:pantetheine-phosphate adenylyltransferase [Oscillospiraceae bacterium OttesenSCG-928-F05]
MIAICPGSFDPVTEGHLDIIHRAADSFDEIVIAVMINRRKQAMFSPEERVAMLKTVTSDLTNVSVVTSDKLLADFARETGINVVVKGLRAVSDFEHEFQMALINKKMNPRLDTHFLMAKEQYMYLSSSAVKEIAAFGGDISDFIPAAILEEVRRRMVKAMA